MPRKKRNNRYSEDDERTLAEDILDFIKVFALSAIVILLFVNFIAHPITVVGHSMDPTLQTGEYGFTSVISMTLSKPERGDVVVLKMSGIAQDDEGEYWVKRVIGLPGETIEAKDGVVYINSQPLDESEYLDEEYMQATLQAFEDQTGYEYGYFTNDFDAVTLGDNEYFVMGDNRPYSKDSRHEDVGPVDASKLYGSGVLIFFPFERIGVY